MTIKKMESVEKSKVAAGEKTWIQVLLAPDETPHFAMRRFTIEPGGFMPYHTNAVEDEPFEFLCLVPNMDDTIELVGD